VANVPVQSDTDLSFNQIGPLTYQALLYELHDSGSDPSGPASNVVPNWFGVAIPNPNNFDLSSDVYVILYFHPTPLQAGYNDGDYPAKDGASGGTDWKELFAYVDRLGGQMAGAIQAGAPANRLVIFPFLTEAQYTLLTSEWFNIIHDILQDINNNIVNGICTRPKKIIVATISDGSVYLNKFLTDALSDQNNNINNYNSNIVEVWDFDSDVASTPPGPVVPQGQFLRAYWQGGVPQNTATATYIHLPGLPPATTWNSFPRGQQLPNEIPPLPPNPSNSNPSSAPDADPSVNLFHHYIRDTMFLDAVFNIESDNPNP
jgi:hypothetical protein